MDLLSPKTNQNMDALWKKGSVSGVYFPIYGHANDNKPAGVPYGTLLEVMLWLLENKSMTAWKNQWIVRTIQKMDSLGITV